MKNKYVLRSRISEAKFRQLVRCFALDLDARQAASITGLNRNTINRYYRLIRQRIAEFCENESPFSGEIEKSISPKNGDFTGGYQETSRRQV